jgi:hypothetical protein
MGGRRMNPLEARRRLLGRNVYKRTTEGNPAIAQGSLARMYPGITMQGWTEQDSTTGAQLFDIASATIGAVSRITGENLEYGANWKRSDYIRVVSGQQYSCTYVENYQDTGFAFYDEQKTFLSGIPCTTNFTVPASAVFCRITVSTVHGDPNIFMLNVGSTVLPWEPYTGRQLSPSPDYKQDVKNSGKYDEETQKYEHGIELAGKNLTDIPDITADMKQTDIPCYIVSQIIISMVDDDVQTTSNVWRIRVTTKDGTMNYLIDGTLAKTFQATPENPIIQITYRGINITAGAYKNIQVEYGDVATEYEPYKTPQTVTLTSDRPLTKWDKLEKRNGQWGWVYKSAEIESYTDESVPGEYYSTTGQLSVGAQVWYETATETFVPLSLEEQEQMNALHTFRPTTVLSNDANCNMILTYKTKKSMGEGNLLDYRKLINLDKWSPVGSDYRHFDISLKPNTTYKLSVSVNNMYLDYKKDYNERFAFYTGETPDTSTNNVLFGNTNVDTVLTEHTFATSENPFYLNLYVYHWNSENLHIVFDELLPNIKLEEVTT